MTHVLLFLGAYALGSIPIGFLVGKAKGVDLREVGSGNIGATNVLRTLGKGPGYFVFLLDVLKGLIPAIAARQLLGSNDWGFGVGLAAVFGHATSPFLGFRGGKGIATGLGALLGSVTLVGMGAFSVFFFVMGLTMLVSLGSLASAISLPFFGVIFGESKIFLAAACVMAIYLFKRHAANIARIRAGTEPRFGQKDADSGPISLKVRALGFGLALAMGLGAAALSDVLKAPPETAEPGISTQTPNRSP